MPANCIIKEQQTLSELADHFQVHRNQISQWKHLLDGTEEIFARKVASENDPSVKELRAKIGRATGDGERFFIRCSRQRS